ncbi:hypothetical protein L226DRAFT_371090 [Lentinus tigrinus ALCF2SS1-7]|uniref:uncharacterized protein n=1 Tax=Lentinus tigrinus ALCF2SS1-7 TaxID=1328758 RepID=UPI0011662B73|nr:hypothetical protein L226DRAFT_371090 [Lentinus tigrinus ALCF2SS1-7]
METKGVRQERGPSLLSARLQRTHIEIGPPGLPPDSVPRRFPPSAYIILQCTGFCHMASSAVLPSSIVSPPLAQAPAVRHSPATPPAAQTAESGLGSSRPRNAVSSHAARLSRMTGIQSTVQLSRIPLRALPPAHACRPALPPPHNCPIVPDPERPYTCAHDSHSPAMAKCLHPRECRKGFHSYRVSSTPLSIHPPIYAWSSQGRLGFICRCDSSAGHPFSDKCINIMIPALFTVIPITISGAIPRIVRRPIAPCLVPLAHP